MNFGWSGAIVGAFMYGLLLGYLDRRFLALRERRAVGGVLLAVIVATTLYAQVGQWNMWTSAITNLAYPILVVALLVARRTPRHS
jgi:tellurite resistance protein TehA-like permease